VHGRRRLLPDRLQRDERPELHGHVRKRRDRARY
jgi:hypothetical protein